MFKLANRMDGLKPSVFTSLLEDKKIYETTTGRTVLDFSLGSPDISPAPAILETMKSAVQVCQLPVCSQPASFSDRSHPHVVSGALQRLAGGG